MPQPTPYNRGHDFKDDHLDAELDDISLSVNEICGNLALIQRDDGRLANGSGGVDQLDTAMKVLRSGWKIRGEWATSTVYTPGDVVTVGDEVYVCLERHLSDQFLFSEHADKWALISGVTASEFSAYRDQTDAA